MHFNNIKTLNHEPLALYPFLALILLRPFIDCFWWVKESNPLLSPLNWAGVLPVLLITFYFLMKLKDIRRKDKGILFNNRYSSFVIRFSKIFLAFSVLLLINAAALVLLNMHSYNNAFMQSISIGLRIISYPLFFLYLYTLIPKINFDLLMKVFLISTLFPFLMITYEIIFGPVNPYTPGGREFDRYRGLYADGINYTIYWLIGLITSAYFYLKNNSKSNIGYHQPGKKRFSANYLLLTPYFLLLTFVICLSAISLFYLNQAVAYFVFAFLFTVILIFVYKKNKLHFLTLSLILILILLLVYLPEIEKPASLFVVDAEIIKGNVEIIHGANGRVWIWLEGLKQLNELPFYSWLFGAGLSQTVSLKYFSAGAHSDYIRILFSTGLAGLLLYLVFIGTLFKGFKSLLPENKFLLLSVIGSLLLFSVTHTPTIYLPFVYFLTTVMVLGTRFTVNGKVIAWNR